MDSVDSADERRQAIAQEDQDCEPLRLAQAFTACSDLYAGILNDLRGQKTLSQPTFISLERAYSYLLLWANGYGVVDGSIEASLDKSKRARQATFRILISISRTLYKKLLPALNTETQAKLSAEASKLTQATNQLRSRMMQVRLDDDSSESDSDSDADSVHEVTDLQEIAEDLRTDTQCLLDLGARFDEPALGTTSNVDQDYVLVQPTRSSDTLTDPVLHSLHESAVPESMPVSPSDQTAEQREWHMNEKDRDGLKELQRTDPRDYKKRNEDATSEDPNQPIPEDRHFDDLNQQLLKRGPSLPKADETVHSQLRSQAVSPLRPNLFARSQVLYDFAGQRENELSIKAGDLIEVVKKEDNGWWLAKNADGQAWVPAAYVEEQAPAPALRTPKAPSQGFSQTLDPNEPYSNEVKDEVKEGVWGYLFPLDKACGGKCLVLKSSGARSTNDTAELTVRENKGKQVLQKQETQPQQTKVTGTPSGSYLIGRHPECDVVISDLIISNRHCLLFATENKSQDTVAVVEDLSSNGTFLNEAIIGWNQRKELKEGDEIAVADKARFIFRYPKSRRSQFLQQYTLLKQMDKGQLEKDFFCVEKSSSQRFAVRIINKTPAIEEYSRTEGLQKGITLLMGVSHPNLVCLKDTFVDKRSIFIVRELEKSNLFNHIVERRKFTEGETWKLFTQLFQGIKYLHDRGIVHGGIKPENILTVDDDLHVKLADFGLAKIFGQKYVRPSYIAPEILDRQRDRNYTKAVDIWTLGVVMYICICGFPPFSDELYSKDFPFTLSQQIRVGRFEYPSPYWDSVSESAIDLIDSMLVVDTEKRFTIDQCLAHPWMTVSVASGNDSKDGSDGALPGLDLRRRGVVRERTLLADINSIKATEAVGVDAGKKTPHTAPELRSSRQHKSGGGTSMRGEADQENPADYEPASPVSD